MESISELKKICQQIRQETDDWYMWNVLRKVSICVTWLLLHTPIDANGVTLLFIIYGMLTSLVFLFSTKSAFFIGSLMLQFWYVLDMVDGEIARCRKESVATGRFFDYMAHYIVHPFLFAAIGLGLCFRYNNLVFFICGIIAGYSVHMVDVITDVSCSVLYKRVKSRILDPDKKVVFKRLEVGSGKDREDPKLKKIFSGLHAVSVFPMIIYLMLPISLLNLFLKADLLLVWLLFYAFAPTIVWTGRMAVFIRQKKIDLEYTQVDKALNSLIADRTGKDR